MKIPHALFSIAVLLTACSGGSVGNGSVSDSLVLPVADERMLTRASNPMAADAPVSAPAPPAPDVRKLIKTGQMSTEVEDSREARNLVDRAVGKLGGYVVSENQSGYDNQLSFSLTIRVPAGRFDSLVNYVESVSRRVENKTISVEDVSAEFVDLEARRRTKSELEVRYREILKTAQSVSEILEVERELNNVRSEIEAMEGRLKYLGDQVAMSTLSVTLSEKITPRTGFFMRIGEAFTSGWNGFLSFITGVVFLWPFGLLIAALWWMIRRWRARRNQG